MSNAGRQLCALAPALLLLSACPSLTQVDPHEASVGVVGTRADDLWTSLSMTNQPLHRLAHRDGGGWKEVPLETALAERIGEARLHLAWASQGKAWLAFRNGGPTELLRIDPAGVTEDFDSALQDAGLTGNPSFHRTATALYLVSDVRSAGDSLVQTVARLTNDGPVRVAALPPNAQLVSVLDDTHVWASTGTESLQLVEGEWKPLADGPFAEGQVPELRVAAPNDVFATLVDIQSTGSLWHYDGAAWTEQVLPAPETHEVRREFVAVGDGIASLISIRGDEDVDVVSRRWDGTTLGAPRLIARAWGRCLTLDHPCVTAGFLLVDTSPDGNLQFTGTVRVNSPAGVGVESSRLFLGYRESL